MAVSELRNGRLVQRGYSRLSTVAWTSRTFRVKTIFIVAKNRRKLNSLTIALAASCIVHRMTSCFNLEAYILQEIEFLKIEFQF